MTEKNGKGCWTCKYLDYYEGYPEESYDDGWCCNGRDDDVHEKFKTFPCNRKLKCFEENKKLDITIKRKA